MVGKIHIVFINFTNYSETISNVKYQPTIKNLLFEEYECTLNQINGYDIKFSVQRNQNKT